MYVRNKPHVRGDEMIQWAEPAKGTAGLSTLTGEVAHTASPLIDFFPQRPQTIVAARSCDTTKSQLLLLLLLLWCFDGAKQTIAERSSSSSWYYKQ